ncbi:hypothetical protein [Streptomyces sioyaensis]
MSTRAAQPLRRPHAPRAPRPPRRRALPAGGPAAADQITTPAAIPGGIR